MFLLLISRIAFSFHKFPMLIIARFTPSQNKVCRLATRFFSIMHFCAGCHCLSLLPWTKASRFVYFDCRARDICLCVFLFAIFFFSHVFSVALMYMHVCKNIQMFILIRRKKWHIHILYTQISYRSLSCSLTICYHLTEEDKQKTQRYEALKKSTANHLIHEYVYKKKEHIQRRTTPKNE